MAAARYSWLIDTSVFIDALRGYKPALDWIESLSDDECFISVITVAELFAGCRNQAEQRLVEREVSLYQMLWLDENISQNALALYQRFRLSHNIGFLDCLIASTARQQDLRVATLNLKHFAPFSELEVKRPY